MNSPRVARTRGWALGFAATTLGLLLALTIAEVILRLFDLQPVGGLATVTAREFDRLPGMFAPGQQLVDHVNRAVPYHVTIDTLGFRGIASFPRRKPSEELRVLMLGDSFTFGYLVDDDSTMPAQLERLLRRRCGLGARVINGGVGGTTIVTAAAMAERSLGLGVDVVVLTFTENDVTDLAAPLWEQLAINREAKSRFPMSVIYPIARNTAIWNLLLSARAKWRSHKIRANQKQTPLGTSESSAPFDAQLREAYRARLRGLRDRLSNAGIPLLLAIYPSHLTVYREGTGELVRWAEAMGGGEGIITINFTDALRKDGRPKEQLYLFPYDGHPSASGYSDVVPLVADSILALPLNSFRCPQ